LPCSVVNVPRDYFSMAGFAVTLYGRFWVSAEGYANEPPTYLTLKEVADSGQ